jgi:hypothetical protein
VGRSIARPTWICGLEGVIVSRFSRSSIARFACSNAARSESARGSASRRKASPKYVRSRSSLQPNDVRVAEAEVSTSVASSWSGFRKPPE